MSVQIYPHLLQTVFLIIAVLVGVTWYLRMICICIFLMTNYIEYLFMGLLALVSSLETHLFKSFKRVFILLFRCKSSFYILHTISLSNVWFANIFSNYLGCVFLSIGVLWSIKLSAHLFSSFGMGYVCLFLFCFFIFCWKLDIWKNSQVS